MSKRLSGGQDDGPGHPGLTQDTESLLLEAWFLAKASEETQNKDFCAHNQTWSLWPVGKLRVVVNVLRLEAEGKSKPLTFE